MTDSNPHLGDSSRTDHDDSAQPEPDHAPPSAAPIPGAEVGISTPTQEGDRTEARCDDDTPVGSTVGDGHAPRAGWALAVILLLGIAARAWVVSRGKIGFPDDYDIYFRWTRALAEHGLAGFYDAVSFCDYPPLALLIMWAVGSITAQFEGALSSDSVLLAIFKIPACLADVVIALALYVEGRRIFGGRRAAGAAALYFLNPVAIYNSAYWGQVDAIHTAIILIGIIFVGRRRFGLAGAFLALALLQKFQSIAFAPLVLLDAYRCRRWQGLGMVMVGGIVAASIVCLPFAMNGVLDDVLPRAYVNVVGQYNELSKNAFNLWYLADHPAMPDTSIPEGVLRYVANGQPSAHEGASPLMWLTWRHISLLAYSLVVAVILSIYSLRPGPIARWGAAGLLGLAFFAVPTEMHERYAHPVLALLAIWAVTGAWRERTYTLLSVLLLLNLTVVLPAGDIAQGIAGLIVLLFVGMLVSQLVMRRGKEPAAPEPYAQVAEEPATPPSALIRWFRRVTLAGVLLGLAGAAGVGYIWRTARPTTGDENGAYVYLGDLPTLGRPRQGWGELQINRSVSHGLIHLGDTYYLSGLGTHAPSTIEYAVPPGFDRFEAVVGVSRYAKGNGSVVVSVHLDGVEVFKSDLLTGKDAPITVTIPLHGAKKLTLKTDATPDGKKHDHVDFALAGFAKTPPTTAPVASPPDTPASDR
ncbi:MAG: NPCBM/NEW2 domain-containing protein [Planctomycetes bacterium]|nr:NPCBM/NEW2 domain-containing protein [Planctomycetota bacterium]